MAVTSRLIAGALPQQVFDVLRDGWSFGHWVVGTREIRLVDRDWPAPGSRLRYRAGYGPLTKDDVTVSLAYQPDERLVLEAKAWPFGTMRIELVAEQEVGGTQVRLSEHPNQGVIGWLHNPPADLLIKLRNVETLRRLEQQVRSRANAPAGG